MLALENISKSFPGVKALRKVSLEVKPGEVHALCGENGAGKSTLMNIISGNMQPDEGKIFWNGEQVQIQSVLQAQAMGISIVYQEKSLVDYLSLAENIFPVNQPKTKFGLIDFSALNRETARLLHDLDMKDMSPRRILGSLSTSAKGMIEVAKAVAKQPGLLILDEPTASLTHHETDILFELMRKLREKGVAIVYISHRMDEIKRISDRVSVLKDGQYQGTVPANTPTSTIIRMMVGRDLETLRHDRHVQREVKLRVHNLSGKAFRDVTFELHKGEILGFAGLLGSGRSEMARALFGDVRSESGTVLIDDKPFEPGSPADAIERGIAYLPDDRKAEGLFLDRDIVENILSARLKRGWLHENPVVREAGELVKAFSIRTPSVKQVVRKLSGGNQQKVVLAKWISTDAAILIVNEPTHGVDVGAKSEIYQILKAMTARGKSIIVISSELPELLYLCDRVGVMFNGIVKAILNREEATEEKIAALASGVE